MTAWEILVSILLGLAINECSEASPWCARRLVRWSAHHRYTDPARADARAEELTALIDDLPGKLFKLFTALGFAAQAVDLTSRIRRTLGSYRKAMITAGESSRSPRRNPAWEPIELVLACDLVVQNDWRSLSASDPRVIELSEFLQKLPFHAPESRGLDFRNPNTVALQSRDMATAHPAYQGRPMHGSVRCKAVVGEFLARPDEMHEHAQLLRNAFL